MAGNTMSWQLELLDLSFLYLNDRGCIRAHHRYGMGSGVVGIYTGRKAYDKGRVDKAMACRLSSSWDSRRYRHVFHARHHKARPE